MRLPLFQNDLPGQFLHAGRIYNWETLQTGAHPLARCMWNHKGRYVWCTMKVTDKTEADGREYLPGQLTQ